MVKYFSLDRFIEILGLNDVYESLVLDTVYIF